MFSEQKKTSGLHVELPVDLVACHLQVPRYIVIRLALQLRLMTRQQLKAPVFFDTKAIEELQVAVASLKKGTPLSELKTTLKKSRQPHISTLYEKIQEGNAFFPVYQKKTFLQESPKEKRVKPKVFQVQQQHFSFS
jgi:hypothetical protein